MSWTHIILTIYHSPPLGHRLHRAFAAPAAGRFPHTRSSGRSNRRTSPVCTPLAMHWRIAPRTYERASRWVAWAPPTWRILPLQTSYKWDKPRGLTNPTVGLQSSCNEKILQAHITWGIVIGFMGYLQYSWGSQKSVVRIYRGPHILVIFGPCLVVTIPLWGTNHLWPGPYSYSLFFLWIRLEDFSSLLIKLTFPSTWWSNPDRYGYRLIFNRWLRWFVANGNSTRGVSVLALLHRLLFCQWKQRCRATRLDWDGLFHCHGTRMPWESQKIPATHFTKRVE